jgi:hypothetical protein
VREQLQKAMCSGEKIMPPMMATVVHTGNSNMLSGTKKTHENKNPKKESHDSSLPS